MNIRRAKKEDVPQLVALKHTFAEVQLQRIEEVDKNEAVYLVAEDSENIVGHIFLKLNGTQIEPNYPNMTDLYVKESLRNKGVGTMLIRGAEQVAKEHGYSKICLAVNPTLNKKVKQLYEKLGYKQTNTKPYIDGVYNGTEDWVVDMVKDLH